MQKYLLRFYQATSSGVRKFRFKNSGYTYTNLGASLESIVEMMDWFDDHPVGKLLKTYDIVAAANTEMVSAISFSVPDELEEEIIATILFFPDQIAFQREDELIPKATFIPFRRPKDRYAR